jgi:hypothetical protein
MADINTHPELSTFSSQVPPRTYIHTKPSDNSMHFLYYISNATFLANLRSIGKPLEVTEREGREGEDGVGRGPCS